MRTFDKIIGYTTIKKELERIADVLRDATPYAVLGVAPPRGLLLHGAPGVGKSLMALCVAEASARPVFTCRKDRPDGAFVDFIRETFVTAEKSAPSIVFLDDLDKFANVDESRHNEEEYVTVQSCMDQLQGKDVFVLATANGIDDLPESLLRARRFDRVIHVDPPKGNEAAQIAAHYLSGKPGISGDIAAEAANTVATLMAGHSCAELETVVNEAGLQAGYARKTHIGREDLVHASLLISHGISPDKIVRHRPDNPSDIHSEMVRVAYHEAGHAVVAETLSPGSVALVCIHNETGGSCGFTSYRPAEKRLGPEAQQNKIQRSLAGRAAIEQRFGLPDIGSGRDLAQARRDLSFLIQQGVYGFSLLDAPRQQDSDELNARREAVIASELERLYLRVRGILADHSAFLDALVAALLERGFLTGEDVQEIKIRYGM